MSRGVRVIECPACDGGRERIGTHCETCKNSNYIDADNSSLAASYRESAKGTDGITELPVTIPPPSAPSFWIITDGTVFVSESWQHLTMEPEKACRFSSRHDANEALRQQGPTALRLLHVLRVDLTATVVDETFSQRNRS